MNKAPNSSIQDSIPTSDHPIRGACVKSIFAAALLMSSGAGSVNATLVDFATDPDTDNWDNHVQLGSAGTATWNSGDEALDLFSDTGDRWNLLSPTGASRGANESVTLDVTSLGASTTHSGDWTFLGLTISSAEAPGFGDGSPLYTFRLLSAGSDINNGLWSYNVIDGANSSIYTSVPAPSFSFTALTMGIERNGDEFDFLINGSSIFTSAGTYDAGQNDSMANYHIAYGSGVFTTLNATVDNFGITAIPEPSFFALLGVGVAMLLAVRRRNGR